MSTSPLPQHAMILAAGQGKRMRPLTYSLPKPLVRVGGKPLIVWHIERLVKAGIRDIVINTAWCGMQLPIQLGDGSAWGARLRYSHECPPGLETAGGIACALKRELLPQNAPFLVINGDIWCDERLDADCIAALTQPLHQEKALGSILLSQNPPHHVEGDFRCPDEGGWIQMAADTPQQPAAPSFTFTGVAVYQPALFQTLAQEAVVAFTPLRTIFQHCCQHRQLWGQHFQGLWYDIGTPERLDALDKTISPPLI